MVPSSSSSSCNPDWEISAQELAALLRDSASATPDEGGSSVLLIDCRTPEERAIAHIKGDVFFPMDEIASRLDELDKLADGRRVVVYCHSGQRSMQVAIFLRQQADYDDVHSLAGGIDGWAVQIDTQMPRY